MRKRTVLNSQRGMTLIEIIVVIVLISLVFGIVAKGVFGRGEAAKAQLNTVKMEKLKNAVEQYRFQYNSYPSKLDDLLRPSGDVKKSGKIFTALVQEDELLDVFGYPYVYRSENNNRSYAITSLGSDGIEGGEGAKQDVTMRP